jgi:hypothetical protein
MSLFSPQEMIIPQWEKSINRLLIKVFGGPGTFFQKGSWPPEAKN